MLKNPPTVFAVDSSYQIIMQVAKKSLVSIKVGEKTYYDESNGIMNSLSLLHRVTVPMKELDSAKKYTVCIRPIVSRRPYFSKTGDVTELEYTFSPVPEKNIRAYHISDAHNQIDAPVNAAKAFGDIDFLILNGDILSHSGSPGKFVNIYEICARITGGSLPVVFSRGNHDMRGNFAESFAHYTPNHSGNTYYTFKLGSIWGLILDCGEDKADDHPEYGFTVACHAFRERQTDYIKSIIENAQNEYAQSHIKTKLIISHIPFAQHRTPPFNIEEDIYHEWSSLLRQHIKPHLMICGHTHKTEVRHLDGELDTFGQPCTVVIASSPSSERYIGCGFIINDDKIEAVFTDSLGNICSKHILEK